MRSFYIALAWRNLLRQKRRTLLTAAAIGVGVFFFIILDSFLIGFDQDATSNIINYETGDLKIVSRAAKERELPELKDLVAGGSGLARRIAGLPEVQAAAPRLLFPAAVTTGLEEIPLVGVGVDPAAEAAVFSTADEIKDGRWLIPGEAGIVLGAKVAKLLDLAVGDQVTVRMQTKTLTFQALDLVLIGLLATPNPNVNQSQFFMDLDVAREALGVADDASEVAVKLRKPTDPDRAAGTIRRLPGLDPGLEVMTWRESAASFIEMMRAERAYDSAFLFLVMVISVIGVVNTILLASLERVREIGLLKALGMTEPGITRIFVLEGILLGLLGGLLGAAAATAVNWRLVGAGFDYSKIMGEMIDDLGFPMSSRIYGVWNWATMLWAIVFAAAVSLAASYIPARKAARLDAVTALRKT